MLRRTGNLVWIESSGGPLLLMARDLLPTWQGITAPTPGSTVAGTLRRGAQELPTTDYDRAAAIRDYVGLIGVGDGQALVLDAQPLITTWIPTDPRRRGGVIVRYVFADDEEILLRLIAQVPSKLWQPSGVIFATGRGPLVMFDSLYSGPSVQLYIRVDLRPGAYIVDTAYYDPDDSVQVLLHRLRPA